jgi:N-acetylneuraminic acid mutarotase
LNLKLNVVMHKLFIAITFLAFSTAINAQSWTQVADLPNGRHHPVTFSLNGKGYAVTGTRSNILATDDFFMYDPVADEWTTLIDFPGAERSFSIGTTYNGKAYMAFGANNFSLLNDLWQYDPVSDQWTQLASCPCAGRRHPSLIAANNKLYAGLGDNGQVNFNDWWMYDIATNQWTQLPNLPGPPRHHPFHFEANGNVYTGMGHGGPNIYGDWYKLDTATNSWTIMTPFPGEHRVAGTQFNHNGYGYVLSGDGDNHSFMTTGEFWRYNPGSDTWLQLDPHPGFSRWAPGSFVIDDVVYFFGGLNRVTSQYPDDTWKYDIVANTIGVDDNPMAQVNFYPNPANDYIVVEGVSELTVLSIFSLTGENLYEETIVTDQKIDISSFRSGIYLLKVVSNNASRVERILVN